ncbi:MAG TPA: NUDIX hydrolase [Xanthomonadaceae bacterium]|nr:NUDIX hydrolase [Xanthomonadaceae bacterium]
MSERKIVHEGRYLRMVVQGHWEYVERTHAGGLAAIIIAVTPDDRILFVEQFRIPLQQKTIEMPAGLVGDVDAGESIEQSAIRELEEETGWRAAHAQVLLVGPTSAGLTSERIAFVRATGLTRTGDGGGDESEDIVVHAVPRAQAPAWLMQQGREGYAVDAKLWAGLWLVDRDPDGTPAHRA